MYCSSRRPLHGTRLPATVWRQKWAYSFHCQTCSDRILDRSRSATFGPTRTTRPISWPGIRRARLECTTVFTHKRRVAPATSNIMVYAHILVQCLRIPDLRTSEPHTPQYTQFLCHSRQLAWAGIQSLRICPNSCNHEPWGTWVNSSDDWRVTIWSYDMLHSHIFRCRSNSNTVTVRSKGCVTK